mgnify:CR=1 FL=1
MRQTGITVPALGVMTTMIILMYHVSVVVLLLESMGQANG